MEERTESSDESFAENKTPKSKPPKKKLKLGVPKDKESRCQFVDDATEAAIGKQFVPKYTATSTKWAVLIDLCCSGEMGETLEIKSMTQLYESNWHYYAEQLATLVRTR